MKEAYGTASVDSERDRKARDRRTRRLFASYRSSGDAEARDLIYRDHLGLAEFHARRYSGRGIDYDDLYQEACLGLISAIEHYDPSLGACFPTYATHRIVGSIKTYFRDKGWSCSLPRSVKSMALRVRNLKTLLGDDPTRQEIADANIVPFDRIEDAICAAGVWSSVNIHQGDDLIVLKRSNVQVLSYMDSNLDCASDRIDVESAVRRTLDAEEATATVLYFYRELTKKEIAELLGCSPHRVSRILCDAQRKLGYELARESLRAS